MPGHTVTLCFPFLRIRNLSGVLLLIGTWVDSFRTQKFKNLGFSPCSTTNKIDGHGQVTVPVSSMEALALF